MILAIQRAYNVPSSDPLAQNTKIFNTIIEPRRDSLGAASCSGSGYVVRRKAIEDIGGWPLVNVGEDIVCSYKLQGAGWKVGFIPDQLQNGLAPASYHSYLKQRMRWVSFYSIYPSFYQCSLILSQSDGTILVARAFRFFLPGARLTSNMRPAPRLAGFLRMFAKYALVWLFALVIFLPYVVWPTATTAAFTSLAYQRERGWLRTLFLLSHISFKCNTYLVRARIGLKNDYNNRKNRIWTSPCK